MGVPERKSVSRVFQENVHSVSKTCYVMLCKYVILVCCMFDAGIVRLTRIYGRRLLQTFPIRNIIT